MAAPSPGGLRLISALSRPLAAPTAAVVFVCHDNGGLSRAGVPSYRVVPPRHGDAGRCGWPGPAPSFGASPAARSRSVPHRPQHAVPGRARGRMGRVLGRTMARALHEGSLRLLRRRTRPRTGRAGSTHCCHGHGGPQLYASHRVAARADASPGDVGPLCVRPPLPPGTVPRSFLGRAPYWRRPVLCPSLHPLSLTAMHTLPSVLRHPSYTGWFYWSAATQLLLANPICTLAYTLAAWSFFRHRIP